MFFDANKHRCTNANPVQLGTAVCVNTSCYTPSIALISPCTCVNTPQQNFGVVINTQDYKITCLSFSQKRLLWTYFNNSLSYQLSFCIDFLVESIASQIKTSLALNQPNVYFLAHGRLSLLLCKNHRTQYNMYIIKFLKHVRRYELLCYAGLLTYWSHQILMSCVLAPIIALRSSPVQIIVVVKSNSVSKQSHQ